MKKAGARNIGAEILKGLRELKRGHTGRVLTYPPVAETRARGQETGTLYFLTAPGPFRRTRVQRRPSDFATSPEGVDRLFFTARIERAHSYRARSASKKNGLPTPSSHFFDRYRLPLWSGFSNRSENSVSRRRAVFERQIEQ